MKKSKIILIFLLLGIAGVFIAYKIAYKPHETIEDLKVEFAGSTEFIMNEIQDNSSSWQNKIVVLNGEVSQKDGSGIVLNSSVYCQLKDTNDLSKISENQQVKIKGRVIGYDDLLEELKLDQVILTE